MKRRLCLGLCAASAACFAQVAAEVNQGYRTEQQRGNIAGRLNDEGRAARQQPEKLIAAIGVKPGMSVADIGTGPGFMLPWLSKAVGPQGTVWAEDIFPDFLAKAKQRGESLGNVRFVLGNEKNVELPANSVDRALILDAYHHFDYPKEMLASVAKALRPGGRLAIVEYHRNDHAMDGRSTMQHVRLTKDEFLKEIEGYGFRAVEVTDFIAGSQWLGLFEKR